jgi:hypothetical protein
VKKVESMSISQFLNSEKETLAMKAERHFKKYGFVYKVVGVTVLIFVAGGGFDYAFASNGIDAPARKLYKEVVNIGKWVIVFKGGIDTIKSIGNGDFDAAKKSFFGYLLTYLFLLGLPYGMDKVDEVFTSIQQ